VPAVQSKEGPNMDYYSVVRDAKTGAVHLFLGIPGGIHHFSSADGGESWVISDCHFAAQLNHLIPISGFLSYSVAIFLK
jgi:hypothetical protein